MKLPPPPAEPSVIRSIDRLAPHFRESLVAVIGQLSAEGFRPTILETIRTDERQIWLYGFGRHYDDGRGIVTNVPTASYGWHKYGLAADLGEVGHEDGSGSDDFYSALGAACVAHHLSWGGFWKSFKDRPHCQWGKPMRDNPSSRAVELFTRGGLEAVWREVGAMD